MHPNCPGASTWNLFYFLYISHKHCWKIFMWAWYWNQWYWNIQRVFRMAKCIWGSRFNRPLHNGSIYIPMSLTHCGFQWFLQVIHDQQTPGISLTNPTQLFHGVMNIGSGLSPWPDTIVLFLDFISFSFLLGVNSWKRCNLLPPPFQFSASQIHSLIDLWSHITHWGKFISCCCIIVNNLPQRP